MTAEQLQRLKAFALPDPPAIGLVRTGRDTRANPCPDPRAVRQPPWGWD